MSKIRVAVIGAGLIGARHARIFHEQPESEVAAVVDVIETRAQAVAALYGAKAYTSHVAALEDDNIDAIVVATPDFLHRDPFVAALNAGKHVLVEKPLATSLEEAREMAVLADASSAVAMVNFTQRFSTDYAWIKKMIDEEEIGRPMMVTSVKFDTLYVPTVMLTWSDRTSPLFFMSSHDLDLTHWFLSAAPVEVFAHETRGVLEAKGIDAHDGLNVLIQFEGGVSTNFHSSWIYPITYPTVANGHMQIIGSEGAITYANRTRTAELCNQRGGQTIEFTGPAMATEVDGKLAGAFTNSLRHFLACILEGCEILTSPRRTLPMLEAQVAALESLRAGRPIPISQL